MFIFLVYILLYTYSCDGEKSVSVWWNEEREREIKQAPQNFLSFNIFCLSFCILIFCLFKHQDEDEDEDDNNADSVQETGSS